LFPKKIPYIQTLSKKYILNYQQYILVGIRLARLLYPDTTGLAYQQMLPGISVTVINTDVLQFLEIDCQDYCICCCGREIGGHPNTWSGVGHPGKYSSAPEPGGSLFSNNVCT
jgi:hypothetical protein